MKKHITSKKKYIQKISKNNARLQSWLESQGARISTFGWVTAAQETSLSYPSIKLYQNSLIQSLTLNTYGGTTRVELYPGTRLEKAYNLSFKININASDRFYFNAIGISLNSSLIQTNSSQPVLGIFFGWWGFSNKYVIMTKNDNTIGFFNADPTNDTNFNADKVLSIVQDSIDSNIYKFYINTTLISTKTFNLGQGNKYVATLWNNEGMNDSALGSCTATYTLVPSVI